MNDQVIKYIREQQASGRTITQIIQTMKEHGYSDGQIDESIRSALESPAVSTTPPPPPPPTIETVQPSPDIDGPNPAKKKTDLTKAFVIIGAILIIAAVIVVINSQWAAASPLLKISFMLIPMLILYGLAYYLNKNERYREVADITLGLASFMLPVTIGTIICQTKIIPEVNGLVIFSSTILAMPIYLIFEYLYKKYFISIFTIVAIFVAYFSLIAQYHTELDVSLWLACALSSIILGVGFSLAKLKIERTTFYLTLGTIATLIFLPMATLYSLNKGDYLSFETNSVIISLFGVIYLCVAGLYYSLYKSMENHTLYTLKRLIEEVSPISILLPYIILGFDKVGYSVLALGLSITFVLISARIIINTLLYLGSLGIIITIITISSKIFTNSIGWPIILFIAGFTAIGIGLLIKRIYQERKTQGTSHVFMGLGADPEAVTAAGPRHKLSTKAIVLIILAVFFGPSLLIGLFSLFRGSMVSDNYDLNISGAKQEHYQSITQDEIIPEASITSSPDEKPQADNLSITGEISVYQFNSNYNTDPKTITSYVEANRIVIHGANDSMIDAVIDENTKFYLNGSELSRDQVYYNVTYKNAILSYYNDGQYNVAKTITFY